jgi:radical SAM protein with 4Fe4S-binding SPASM domain
MLIRQKFDTFVRIYDDIGYIVNKSDFHDRVTDASGAIFLKALSRKPKTLKELTNYISKQFIDANITEIRKDAIEFYAILEHEGFIVSGHTELELDRKDVGFSYAALSGNAIKNTISPIILSNEKSTQDYLNEYFKDKPHLTSFQIELTSRCNERCVHCYIPHESKADDIDPAFFYDILDQAHDMGVLELTLSGGEALLHPHFCDFLQKAKEKDFSVGVLSNLTLLTDEIISVMKGTRLSSVQVSLYSMEPLIHDAITKIPGSFKKTKSAILRLIENDIPLQISCPMMKQNKNCYRDVLQWAHEHKCRAQTDLIMMARYDHSTDNLENRLSVDEVGNVITEIINNDITYQSVVNHPNFEKIAQNDMSNDILCGVCLSEISMVANGNIYPCAGWQDYIVGNAKKTPLKEIWENAPKVKYLRGLRKKDLPKCVSCPDRAFCAVCMVRNANESPEGDPLKINEHFCKVAAINRKIVLDWKAEQTRGRI